jgi:predicted Zn-dependent peptidase
MAGLYQVRAGDFRPIYSVLADYDSVTSADILRVAQKYLRPENRTVVTLHPVSPKEHGDLGELE